MDTNNTQRALSQPTGDSSSELTFFNFKLYIAGQTPKSLAAMTNLKKLCENYLPDSYCIEIIDIVKHPELAIADQILALPTLIRRIPEPIKRMIGTLSDTEKVLVGLDIGYRHG